jgi:hypothetical protein
MDFLRKYEVLHDFRGAAFILINKLGQYAIAN